MTPASGAKIISASMAYLTIVRAVGIGTEYAPVGRAGKRFWAGISNVSHNVAMGRFVAEAFFIDRPSVA
jgi:hypothetical protein